MEKLIENLTKFIPNCEQEEADKKIFLDCAKEKNSLTRENLLYHFTASAVVINEQKTKSVGAYYRLYKSWAWLGGHADGDPDLLNVARKEVQEESGLKDLKLYSEGIFSIESLPVIPHIRKGKYISAHVHLNVTYVFVADEKQPLQISEEEHSDIAWVTFKEFIEKTTEPHLISIYKKLINKITHSKIGNKE